MVQCARKIKERAQGMERKIKRNEKKKKKARKAPWLGRMLAKLPTSSPLLYPLYLAAQLDTKKETYCSPDLPQAFDGFTIAFLSDIHYGALFSEARVRSLVQKVNELQADIVLLGGDYGENSDGAVEFFRMHPGFQARIAVLAAVGNHDRYDPESNLALLQDAMREDGAIPVINDVYVVTREGKKLAFAGSDDFYAGSPDIERLEQLCRGMDFTVFFPHNPDTLPLSYEICPQPFYRLALCGHTHGGQVTVCGRTIKYSSLYGRRYLSGWFHENGADILVSNGVGTTGIPMRLGARPQIHLLTLKAVKK